MAPTRAQVAETPNDLLSDPIAWFFAEHLRHRQFCDLMQRASMATTFDEEVLSWLLDFVVHELALHVLDEEEDLFPLMRARAQPEDALEAVLGRLSGEHAKDLTRAAAVRRHLEMCLRQQVPISRNNVRRRALEGIGDVGAALLLLREGDDEGVGHQNHDALLTRFRRGRPAAKDRQLSSMIW